jgi:hypothetical protein
MRGRDRLPTQKWNKTHIMNARVDAKSAGFLGGKVASFGKVIASHLRTKSFSNSPTVVSANST